jgi:hypothetical protein
MLYILFNDVRYANVVPKTAKRYQAAQRAPTPPPHLSIFLTAVDEYLTGEMGLYLKG